MKHWMIIKTILYSIAGILVLIFNNSIMGFVGLTVGSVVIFYGVDIAVLSIINKRYFGENALFFGGLVQILMGIMLFLVKDNIVSICLVWAVWSILREGKELSEAIHKMVHRKRGFVNAAESVVIIVFSFMMALEPSEHHAHFHVIILGVELLLEVLFPYADMVIDRIAEKRKQKTQE